MNRRFFLEGTAVSALLALVSSTTTAAVSSPSVIVVGGGMAGATVAKFIRLWSRNAIQVLVIDINETYVSNIMSNLVVTGQLAGSSLNFTYENLKSKYGVQFQKGRVTEITRSGSGWNVSVDGISTPFWANRIVLAPGISFDPVPLLNVGGSSAGADAPILHAWQAGEQTNALKLQLSAFPSNGTYLLSIPKSPYRCPPGPYERACVIADYLKRTKTGAKVVVLDANPSIQAEPIGFGDAFKTLYGDMLTYVPNAVVTGVYYNPGSNPTGSVTGSNSAGKVRYDETTYDANNKPVTTTKSVDAALINIIPKHRAAKIVQNVTPAGSDPSVRLANGTDKPFARIDAARGFAAADQNNFPGIHVIGDSHQVGGTAGGSGLPMAGHVANEEAKICASAIVADLANGPPLITKYLTSNSACYSPVNSTMASWLTLVYHYDTAYTGADGQKQFWPSENGKIAAGPPDANGVIPRFKPIEAATRSTENFSKMRKWYQTLMRDSFS